MTLELAPDTVAALRVVSMHPPCITPKTTTADDGPWVNCAGGLCDIDVRHGAYEQHLAEELAKAVLPLRDARVLREAADRLRATIDSTGFGHLSRNSDAWLRAEADRIEQEPRA